MHLKITAVEVVDTNKPWDLFINADANGIAVCVRQMALYNDDGSFNRYVEMNDALIKHLKESKIPIK